MVNIMAADGLAAQEANIPISAPEWSISYVLSFNVYTSVFWAR